MNEMKISTSTPIAASAAEAWTLFGEGFGEWASWAPGIDASTLEGPLAEGVIRVNKTPSLGTVRQTLVRYTPEEKALAYEVSEGLPPFLQHMRNDWVIREDGDGRCVLEGEALFLLTEQSVPMKPKLQGKMGMVLETFATAVRETLEGAKNS